jgi:ribosomal protein L40E
MGELGYGTRGPIVAKLKQLLADIQNVYESFLDAQTLYQQGKMDERVFFARMGEFVKALSALGFLTVKAVLEIDAAVGAESKKPAGITTPSPSMTPEMMGMLSAPVQRESDSKSCAHCGAKIPKVAKFCTKCGKPQG